MSGELVVRVGKGSVLHLGIRDPDGHLRTRCGAEATYSGSDAVWEGSPVTLVEGPSAHATCKRCLRVHPAGKVAGWPTLRVAKKGDEYHVLWPGELTTPFKRSGFEVAEYERSATTPQNGDEDA